MAEVAHRAGEAEGGGGEAQREQFLGLNLGVEEQVAAGDADVERALADVDGDVAGAEEEELNVVVRVHHDQLAGVAALAVAGLGEHGGGGFGQGALVGDGNSQHWGVFLGVEVFSSGKRATLYTGSAGQGPGGSGAERG